MASAIFELKPFDQWAPPGTVSGNPTGVRFTGDANTTPVPQDKLFTLTDENQIRKTKVDPRFTLISETP